jgi:hypothetical protein
MPPAEENGALIVEGGAEYQRKSTGKPAEK